MTVDRERAESIIADVLEEADGDLLVVARAVIAALEANGHAVVELPAPRSIDFDDDDRPKCQGDYLNRDDSASEVWVEGLPGSPPYVFFGRRHRGPSYMPAEYARDVAAALLAAARAAESGSATLENKE